MPRSQFTMRLRSTTTFWGRSDTVSKSGSHARRCLLTGRGSKLSEEVVAHHPIDAFVDVDTSRVGLYAQPLVNSKRHCSIAPSAAPTGSDWLDEPLMNAGCNSRCDNYGPKARDIMRALPRGLYAVNRQYPSVRSAITTSFG